MVSARSADWLSRGRTDETIWIPLSARSGRQRVDFSRIKTSLPIPNLIDVQSRSYERFLQMNLLPEEREAARAAGRLHRHLPVLRLPGDLRAPVRQVLDRQLGVQVRPAQGPRVPAHDCRRCGAQIMTAHPHEEMVTCLECGSQNKNRVVALRRLRQPGRAADQVLGRRVPGAGHDLLRAAQGHLPPLRLRQGPRDGRQDDAGRQGRGGLLRRHPADDRARHVRHQRHRARHRLPAAPLAGRLLHRRSRPRLPGEDHPVPRFLGGVRVRPEGVLFVRIDRKRKFPATIFLRALGLEYRRVDPAQVLHAGPGAPQRGRQLRRRGDAAGARGGAAARPPAPRPP